MPDAIEAILQLASVDRDQLSRTVYNVGAFSPSAGEFRDKVLEHFPDAEITFEPDVQRQAIVDSWPEDVNDDAARRDWGFAPKHDFDAAFEQYLLERIRQRYQ